MSDSAVGILRQSWLRRKLEKTESIIGESAKGIVRDEKSHQLVVRQLRREIKDRCDDLPVEADLATEILKPSEWKRSEFFSIKSGSCVSPTHHPTEIFNSDIKKITSKAKIRLQLESKILFCLKFYQNGHS